VVERQVGRRLARDSPLRQVYKRLVDLANRLRQQNRGHMTEQEAV
jgi:hypothetical protein